MPTEAEFEAAARGKAGRSFTYGKKFDASRCNTFESHIRRTTPVGIFDNATPEGAFDLSGNAYTWTSSIYDQDKFPYPYRSDDGREDILATGVRRVLRGGSRAFDHFVARAVNRNNNHPADRNNNIGFRVVVVLRPTPPSLLNGLAARAAGGPLTFIRTSGFRQCWPSTICSRGEEIEKAQPGPVRTGEKHRRAHIKKRVRSSAFRPMRIS